MPGLILSALFCPCRSAGLECRLCVHPGSRLSAFSFEVKTLSCDVSACVLLDWQKAPTRGRKSCWNQSSIFYRAYKWATSHGRHMPPVLAYFWCSNTPSERWDEDVCEHTGVRFSRPYTTLRENKQAARWQAEPQTWCTQCSQNITMSSHITEQIHAGWIALSTKHTHTHTHTHTRLLHSF